MSDTILELRPLAPLLFRDGRPFSGGGEESRAQSLDLPLPSTLAGFLRTQLGEAGKLDWHSKELTDEQLHKHLKHLHTKPVRSVLLRDGEFMFPAPLNAVIEKKDKKNDNLLDLSNLSASLYTAANQRVDDSPDDKDKVTIHRSEPTELKDGEGVLFTDEADADKIYADLRPLLLIDEKDEKEKEFKPENGYRYWPLAEMQQWLLGKTPNKLEKISGPALEERTSVMIDPLTSAGDDGKLFSVNYRSFDEYVQAERQEGLAIKQWAMKQWTIRIKTGLKDSIAAVGFLGGERRPVALQDLGNQKQWPNIGEFKCVEKVLLNTNNKRICFILTSPALFDHGWRPAWLTNSQPTPTELSQELTHQETHTSRTHTSRTHTSRTHRYGLTRWRACSC